MAGNCSCDLGGDVDLQVDLALGGVNLAEDLDLRCGFEISLRRDLIEHSLCIVGSECGVGANRT